MDPLHGDQPSAAELELMESGQLAREDTVQQSDESGNENLPEVAEEVDKGIGGQGPPTESINALSRFSESLSSLSATITPQGPSINLQPYLKDGSGNHDFKNTKRDNFVLRTRIDLNIFITDIARIKQYYRDFDIEVDDAELARNIVRDSAFILEVLHQFNTGQGSAAAPAQLTPLMVLIKMENQIPYFLLTSLFERIGEAQPNQGASSLQLTTLAWKYLKQAISMDPDENLKDPSPESAKPWHLLHLLHMCLDPSLRQAPGSDTNVFLRLWHSIKMRFSSEPSTQRGPFLTEIRGASQLRDSGITLRRNSRVQYNFLEIEFSRGEFSRRELRVPFINLNAVTKIVLLNCVAHEQSTPDQPNHITAYVAFMKLLLRQREDVELLRSERIINFGVEDSQDVITFFSNLTRNLQTDRESYLSQLSHDIHSFYNSCGAKSCLKLHRNWKTVLSLILGPVISIASILVYVLYDKKSSQAG